MFLFCLTVFFYCRPLGPGITKRLLVVDRGVTTPGSRVMRMKLFRTARWKSTEQLSNPGSSLAQWPFISPDFFLTRAALRARAAAMRAHGLAGGRLNKIGDSFEQENHTHPRLDNRIDLMMAGSSVQHEHLGSGRVLLDHVGQMVTIVFAQS